MGSAFHVPLARFAVFTVGHHSNLVRPRSIHCSLLLSPEVSKAIGRQLGIAHGVLDIPETKISLQSPGIVSLVSQGEADPLRLELGSGGPGGRHARSAPILFGGWPA